MALLYYCCRVSGTAHVTPGHMYQLLIRAGLRPGLSARVTYVHVFMYRYAVISVGRYGLGKCVKDRANMVLDSEV